MKILQNVRNKSSIDKKELIKIIYQNKKRYEEIRRKHKELKKIFPENFTILYNAKNRVEKIKHAILSLKKK